MTSKTALTILVSIILTIILISIVNVGTSLFLEKPEYEDYCGDIRPEAKPIEQNESYCIENQGTWKGSYWNYYEECQEEYENAMKPYNQIRYYIFAGIGFILLLIGLFAIENMIQITGLATGGILVMEGIVINLENKWIVFLSLIAILIIFGILAYKIIKEKKK